MANVETLELNNDQIDIIRSLLELIPSNLFGNAILSFYKRDNEIYTGIETLSASHEYMISFEKKIPFDDEVFDNLSKKRYPFFCTNSIFTLFKKFNSILLTSDFIAAQKTDSKGKIVSEIVLTLINAIENTIEIPHNMKTIYSMVSRNDESTYEETELTDEDVENILDNMSLLEKAEVFNIKINNKGIINISAKDFTKSQVKMVLSNKIAYSGINIKIGEPFIKIMKEMKKFKNVPKKIHISEKLIGFIIDDSLVYVIATLL